MITTGSLFALCSLFNLNQFHHKRALNALPVPSAMATLKLADCTSRSSNGAPLLLPPEDEPECVFLDVVPSLCCLR